MRLVTGLFIFLLGVSFGDISSSSTLDGIDAFALSVKPLGETLGVALLTGIGWTLSLADNPEPPGYPELA